MYFVMKRFYLLHSVIFFFVELLFACSLAYAQDGVSYKYSMSFKKGTEETVKQQLKQYLCSVSGITESDSSDSFNGHIEGITYSRSGLNKSIYSIDYRIIEEIKPGKIFLYYTLDGIKENRTVCDRSQSIDDHLVSIEDVPQFVDVAFGEASSKISECAWRFIKSGQNTTPVLQKIPYWYGLNYVVEPHAVTYYAVLQSKNNLSKEALFKILENYFTYAYKSGKAVIENKDPEECSIIAKGIYKEIHNWGNQELYDVSHIINVQCRDGRVRVSFTLDDYDIRRVHVSAFTGDPNFTRNIAEYEPFGNEKDKEMVECLEKVEIMIMAQFVEIQKAINEGNNAVDALDDW